MDTSLTLPYNNISWLYFPSKTVFRVVSEYLNIFLFLPASVLDLVFAIDGSDSLLPEQFNHLKQLIKNMIDEYTISQAATRVGVIEYSDKVGMEINLNDFFQAWKLKDAVDKIKASNNKGAVTDVVLRKAADEMFKPEKGWL
jgi:hypothetical protein